MGSDNLDKKQIGQGDPLEIIDDVFEPNTAVAYDADLVLGSVDGASSEATTANYQGNISLSTSFTGDDLLTTNIHVGNRGTIAVGVESNMTSTSDALQIDTIAYTLPVGDATVMIGKDIDSSVLYYNACAYNAFSDHMNDCGTGNSSGLGTNGFTVAGSYEFEGGFAISGGFSSSEVGLLTKESTDNYGFSAFYGFNEVGASVAVSFANDDSSTYWGFNGIWDFEAGALSVGFEHQNPPTGDDKIGFLVGLSLFEVGPGELNIGYGTTDNFDDSATKYYQYELMYTYDINDAMQIAPVVYIKEGATDQTGIALKTSFSF